MKNSLTPLGILLVASLSLAGCGENIEKIHYRGSGSGSATKEISSVGNMSSKEMIESLSDTGFVLGSGSIQELSNHIYTSNGSQNIRGYIQSLTGSDTNTILNRTYLQSALGEYGEAIADRDMLCKRSSETCPQESVDVQIGPIVDQSGNTISHARVYIDTKMIDIKDVKKPLLYQNMVHRIRVEKEGYLDSYGSLNNIPGGYNILSVEPKLVKADLHISTRSNISKVASINNFTFSIAPGTFVNKKGEAVEGNIDIYFYSLDRKDNDLSVFQLDAYGKNGEKLGDKMITYGMPLVTAYKNGEILSIKKPIEGTGTILNQDASMDFIKVPKDIWLQRKDLAQYKIPPFWSLDIVSGVWEESEMMILDTMGNYKFRLK